MDRSFRRFIISAFAATALFPASVVEAQIFTPTFMGPRPGSDIAVYLSDGPGDFGIEAGIRRAFGGIDVGGRLGIAATNDQSFLVSGELRQPLPAAAPLGLALTGAAQAALGEVSGGGVAVGIAVGPTLQSGEILFTPYAHPRVGLVDSLSGDGDLELMADLGFDLRVSPRFDLRFGLVINDQDGEWGVGLAWR